MNDRKDKQEDVGAGPVQAELLAHPLAFPAIAATIGMGVASQVLGFWMGAFSGTMTGAMQASRGIAEGQIPPGGTAADNASMPSLRQPAAARATKAVKRIIDDAHKPSEPTDHAPAKAKPAIAVSASASIEASDDLKAISGIGPKLEQVLNKLGVSTYAQIAAWTGSEIARIEEHFGFPGRVGRDGWVAQAQKFLGERGAVVSATRDANRGGLTAKAGGRHG